MVELMDAPEHVIALRLSGEVNEEDYTQVMQAVEQKLGAHEHVAMLVDLTGFEDMTYDALQKRISYGFKKLGELNRFKRVGVITNKQWIKVVTEVAGKLVPTMKARAFDADAHDEAADWIAQPV